MKLGTHTRFLPKAEREGLALNRKYAHGSRELRLFTTFKFRTALVFDYSSSRALLIFKYMSLFARKFVLQQDIGPVVIIFPLSLNFVENQTTSDSNFARKIAKGTKS